MLVSAVAFRIHAALSTWTNRPVGVFGEPGGERRCPIVPMLELRDVSKCFAGITAVDQVSFCARAGEVTGYLGPNGSGKSTTMKMITGIMEATSKSGRRCERPTM